MKCFIVFALLFVGALGAPSASDVAEPSQGAIESTELAAAEDTNTREKKSAYYKPEYYKPEYKTEYHGPPVNAVFPKPPGPCAIPLLVSCKSHVDYGKLEYKPEYKSEYKPEYKSYY